MMNVTRTQVLQQHLTTKQVADLLGVECWRVQRIFENGEVPEPTRFAGKRAIPGALLPRIVDALRAHEWLPDPTDAEVLR
jgi:hypothetical protein